MMLLIKNDDGVGGVKRGMRMGDGGREGSGGKGGKKSEGEEETIENELRGRDNLILEPDRPPQ